MLHTHRPTRGDLARDHRAIPEYRRTAPRRARASTLHRGLGPANGQGRDNALGGKPAHGEVIHLDYLQAGGEGADGLTMPQHYRIRNGADPGIRDSGATMRSRRMWLE